MSVSRRSIERVRSASQAGARAACGIATVALLALGCGDSPAGTGGGTPVGDTLSFMAALSSAPESAERAAWVSLPPGALTVGDSARIVVRRTGEEVSVSIVGGGFDPVRVAAVDGDEIEATISAGDSVTARHRVIVVARPPRIVRTSPPKHTRDVPLNAVVVIVFSEPVDPATVTSATVRLRRSGVTIGGTLGFLDATRTSVTFTPAAPLAPAADHQIVIEDAVRDFSGAQLEAGQVVPFATAAFLTLSIEPDSVFVVRPGVGAPLVGAQLTANLLAGGTPLAGRTILWSSSDETIAAVSAGGLVTAVGPGRTIITARSGALVASAVAYVPVSEGDLRVVVASRGSDPDGDGYGIRVWSAAATGITGALDGDGSVLFRDLHALPSALDYDGPTDRLVRGRQYRVELDGVAPNCFVEPIQGWGTLRNVEVVGGDTAVAAFTVTCEAKAVARLAGGSQLAFVRGGRIHLVNSDGSGAVALTSGPADCEPAWSPDGRRIAFVRGCDGQARDIHVMDADGSNVARRTSGGWNETPGWSPDGRRIVFAALVSGSLGIFEMSADDDGSGARVVVDRPGWDAHPAWSPDGSRIAFVSDWTAYDITSEVYVASPDGSTIAQLTDAFWTGPLHYSPAWSPDGRRLALVTCAPSYDTCDASTISLMSADGSGLAPLAAARRGSKPTWSPDGRTIAFSSAGIIHWIHADGSARGLIVEDGHSPAWKP
jgi:hypothetical protein